MSRPKKVSNKKPVADEVKKAVNSAIVDIVTDKVAHLELQIKMIHYFLKHELKINKYKIDIDFEKLSIFIHSEPIHFQIEESLWRALAIKLGMPNFKITFEQDYVQ